jgi:two-component system cell cycle response regulator
MPSLPRARPDLMAARWLPDAEARQAPAGRLYKVALHGFSEFERKSLGSFFRLVSDRTPAYELWPSTDDSDFVIADATSDLIDDLRIGLTVFIGSQAPVGALARLARPIDPVNIVRALDAKVSDIEAALPPRHEPIDFDDSDPVPLSPKRLRSDDDDDPFYFEELAEIPIPPALAQLSLPLVHPPANWDEVRAKDVLIVDDSALALRFLESRLRRLGYRVYRALTSVHALELLAEQSFSFVFLDVSLAEGDRVDGLQLCRHLKERNRYPGEPAPIVVLVSAHANKEDRLRGEFAGCDAYLTKPVDERDLVNTLGRHDPTFGRTLDPD